MYGLILQEYGYVKGWSVILEADKVGCYDLSTNSGCIYLDADMIITEKLGDIYSGWNRCSCRKDRWPCFYGEQDNSC